MYEPEKIQGRNIMALKNQDFLCLRTMTGRGLLCVDPDIPHQVMQLDTPETNVGDAVLYLLKQSTVLSNDDFQILFKSGRVQENAKIWEESIFKKYSYKTKSAIYRKMLQCGIKDINGILTFSPTHHYKMQSWNGGTPGEFEKVVISSDSSNEEVGLALEEAFSRCTNSVP